MSGDPPNRGLKKPCNNCPFRPRTFTPLLADDVGAMLDELSLPAFFMYCHKDMLYQRVECTGSVMFKRGEQSGDVFTSAGALVRAHRRSCRKPEFRWNLEDGSESS